jgi:ribose/xylose/arabinose/galactoside ABC-type transport system permease subunit
MIQEAASTDKSMSPRRLSLSPISFQNLIILIILLLVSAGMSFTSNNFFSASNFSNIIVQASMVIITGSAATLVLISGNLDLSVGGLVAMSGVLYALFCQAKIPPYPWAALFAVLIAGTLMGFVNGTLVTRLKMPSFIATLGVMYIARGIAYIGAKGTTIAFGLPADFPYLGNKSLGPIPLPIVYTVIALILFIFIQTKTRLGKQAFAIGSNKKAAVYSGINEKKVITVLYILTGTMAAFSGLLFTARIGVADCTIGSGFEFEVISASVLGGTSVSGGKGSIIGMFLGALLMRVLTNGLNLIGLASFYQNIVSGIILILAILLNRFIVNKFSYAATK